MKSEIEVKVHSYGPGRPLSLVYFDPITGKKKAKSSGTDDWREAERLAAVLEDELLTGRYQAASKVAWEAFVARYKEEKLSTLAPKTQKAALESLGLVTRILNPDRLCKMTAALMSRLTTELRKPRVVTRNGEQVTRPPVCDATVARHLRHIKAALRWGEGVGMLAKAPKIEMPKRAKGQSLARSRPVTLEEFERMLDQVPAGLVDTGKARRYKSDPPKRVVRHKSPEPGPEQVAAWRHYLRGLWLSGLRLEESLALSWDEGEPFTVDLLGRRPAFRIYGEAQKSGRDELLPMTPDFAQFIQVTAEAERHGRVFKLIGTRSGRPMTPADVGEVVRRIGRKASVVVNKADGKYATAHDLRRAFGTRWAKRVMPAILKRLMRHSSINTTMAYYVDLDAAEVADDLWAKWGGDDSTSELGNTSGNNDPRNTTGPDQAEPVNHWEERT
jgi:integrase